MADLADSGEIDVATPPPPSEQDADRPARPARRRFDLWGILQRPTGEGDLEAYRNDPFNPAPERPEGARVARGVAGLTGGANWAIIDVLFGLWGLQKPAGKEEKTGGGVAGA